MGCKDKFYLRRATYTYRAPVRIIHMFYGWIWFTTCCLRSVRKGVHMVRDYILYEYTGVYYWVCLRYDTIYITLPTYQTYSVVLCSVSSYSVSYIIALYVYTGCFNFYVCVV
jgi:hypothetical protein